MVLIEDAQQEAIVSMNTYVVASALVDDLPPLMVAMEHGDDETTLSPECPLLRGTLIVRKVMDGIQQIELFESMHPVD